MTAVETSAELRNRGPLTEVPAEGDATPTPGTSWLRTSSQHKSASKSAGSHDIGFSSVASTVFAHVRCPVIWSDQHAPLLHRPRF